MEGLDSGQPPFCNFISHRAKPPERAGFGPRIGGPGIDPARFHAGEPLARAGRADRQAALSAWRDAPWPEPGARLAPSIACASVGLRPGADAAESI
jgi:hypothetical protein